MKFLFSMAFAMLFGLAANSQNVMHLQNRTNCDLMIHLFVVNSGGCGFVSNVNYMVPANSSTTAIANVGEEFVHAEVTSFPFCSGGVAFDISTPMNCYSTCAGYTMSYYIGTNSGCNGCLPTINAKWNDCYDVNEGILTIIDF